MALLAINVDGGQTDAGLSLAPFGSLFPGSSVLTSGSLLVSAQVAPDMSVKVRGSDDDDAAIIKLSTGATYYVKNTDPNESVTILANSSGVTKTDAIVGYVDLTAGDPDNAGSPGAFNLIAVRRGSTNTGAPTDGEIDAATSNNPWIRLATVVVTNGATEITGSDITDSRTQAKVWLPASDDTITTDAIVDEAVTRDKIALGATATVPTWEVFNNVGWNVLNAVLQITPAQAADYSAMTVTVSPRRSSDTCTVKAYTSTDGTGTEVASFEAVKGVYTGSVMLGRTGEFVTVILPTTVRSLKIAALGGAGVNDANSRNAVIMAYHR